MSEFRIEKQRVHADLMLATGATVSGSFFLSGATPLHVGLERVGDLLNSQSGFFPFERSDGTTALYNRKHVVIVALAPGVEEAQLDPGYEVSTRRMVAMILSSGMRVAGQVAVSRPVGRDRLSDYTRTEEIFRYVVTPEHTFIVNAEHIVELMETAD